MFAHVQVEPTDLIRLKRRLSYERNLLTDEMNAELARDGAAETQLRIIDSVRDRGDEAVVDLYSDLALASIQIHFKRLRAIENALYRINKDVFGVCLDCGKPIDRARLDADPAVTRCMKCQTMME